MTPLQRYRNDLSRADFGHDAAQERAVHHLQQLYEELNRPEMEKSGLLGWFFKSPRGHEPVIGLYMWGGVGRGKTYLMDAFYECLTVPLKMRMHFHSFMRLIHGNLKQIKDAADPLQIVANDITREARVLCFDEFHVADITDAMLLGRLLEHLFQRGVTLVATSNEAPDDLYSGGLQRERFVPAIELIKRHTRVLHVDNGIDYRLRVLEHAEIYHCRWTIRRTAVWRQASVSSRRRRPITPEQSRSWNGGLQRLPKPTAWFGSSSRRSAAAREVLRTTMKSP